MSEIDNARAAGFSDEEIGAYNQQLRQQGLAAGFSDEEINQYLGGGVAAPKQPPKAWIDRLQQGGIIGRALADTITDIKNTAAGAVSGAEHGWEAMGGGQPAISPDTEEALRKIGLFGDPKQGQAPPLQFLAEAALRPIAGLWNTMSAATGAAIGGAAGLLSSVAFPSTLAKAKQQAQQSPEALERDLFQLGQASMVVGGSVTRPEIDPLGRPTTAHVGGYPTSEDFTNAAKVIAGPAVDTKTVGPPEAPISRTERKLLDLFNYQGMTPAEVAKDAESDVTITQTLVSSGTDKPERYVPPEPASLDEPAPGRPSAPEPPAIRPVEPKVVPLVTPELERRPAQALAAMLPFTREKAPPISFMDRRLLQRAAEIGEAAYPEPEPPPVREMTEQQAQSLMQEMAYETYAREASQEIPNTIRALRPEELLVDADRFQFKSGADEAGVTERLRDVENWDQIKAGLTLAWEDNNGQKFIVDGHQRLALAQRIAKADPAQTPMLNTVLLREADGVSDVAARSLAAAKNIAEGTGTAVDAAKVLRDYPEAVKDLPPRSELVRQARGLANLDPNSFGMVVNEVVPPNYGAIVGRLVPDDPKMQGALMELLAKTEPANLVQAESIVRQGIDAGTYEETQQTLFGDQVLASSLFLDRAKVLDRTLRMLKRDRDVFSTIVKEEDILTAVGNRLESGVNAQRAATDAQAIQILQTLANRRGPLSDALNAAAGRARESGNYAAAGRDFAAAIRSQSESGDLIRGANGLARGRGDAAGENAPSTIDPAATEPRRADEAAASERAADLIQTERTEQGEQLVIPGAERSARQAMEAREAEGRGRIRPQAPQEPAGGLFAPPAPEQPGLEFGPETGAVAWGRRPPAPPGSLEEAQDSILNKLSIGEPGQKRGWSWGRLYTNVLDKLYPISRAVGQAANGAGILTPDNPYQLSRLISGLAGKITGFLDGYDRRGNLVGGTRDWTTDAVNGESLRKILDSIADNRFDQFRAFAASARGLELESRGITTGLDLAAMQHVAREGVAEFGPVLDRLVDYQNRVAAYLRDAGVLSRDGYDAMVKANQLYVPFNRVMGDGDGVFRSAAGSLQPSDPIHRILGSERDIIDPIESIIRNTATMITMAEKNNVVGRLRDMLTAAGQAGRPSRAPIAPLTLPVDPALDAALQQFLQSHGVQQPQGLLGLLNAAASAPAEVGTIRVFDNGVPHYYQVDPELATAVKGLDADTIGFIEKAMAPFARVLRGGAVLNPDFMVRHTFRDFLYASVTNVHGLFTPMDMARGFYGLINKDERYWNWLQGGGANISMVSLDRRYLQESIDKLTEQTGLMTRALNIVADPNSSWLEKAGPLGKAIAGLPFKAASKYVLHPLQLGVELVENASHLGAFIKESERLEALGVTGKEQIQRAAFTSRDVAVDAARIGAKMRAFNMVTAFANITLQDTDRVVRAFVNDPVSTSIKVGAYIVAPSALLWWANHDDPRYQELPEWQKDMFWIFPTNKWEDVGPASQYGPPNPGTPYRVENGRLQVNNGAIFRLPKPWGMGVLFGSGTERALEAFSRQEPEAFQHWGNSIFHTVTPQFLPSAVQPMIDQWTNRNTFTNRTLIPGTMEKMMPEYQYTPYTTETAKALGRIIGAFPGMHDVSMGGDVLPQVGGVARALTSPILIENYIRGYAGNLGRYTLELADAALRKEGILPDPPQPASTLADLPVIRAFTIRYPSATAQSIQDFEDGYSKNKMFYDTWLAKQKEGDAVAMARIQKAGGPAMFAQLDWFQKTLNEHNQLVRDLAKNPTMSPGEKRQLIDTVYYRMIEVGQAGKAALAQVDRALH